MSSRTSGGMLSELTSRVREVRPILERQLSGRTLSITFDELMSLEEYTPQVISNTEMKNEKPACSRLCSKVGKCGQLLTTVLSTLAHFHEFDSLSE